MISLDKVKVSNFGPFEAFELGIASRGLVLIQGDNQDTTSATSNGAGKSHIFKAVTWALFGDTAEGDKHDKVIRHGAKLAKVSVDWTDEAGQWTVERSKGRATAATLLLEHNGVDVSAPTIAATQAEIVKRLGLDFQTWLNTVLYAQSDLVRFADPATSDADRKLILKRILRLEVLDKAAAAAKKRLDKLQANVDELERERIGVQAGLDAIPDVAVLRKTVEDAEEEQTGYQKIADKLPRLNKVADQISEVISESNKRRAEVKAIEAEAATAGEAKATALTEMRTAKQKMSELEEEFALFDEGKCPTCGTKATVPHIKKHLAELEARLRAAAAAETEAQARADQAAKLQTEARTRALALSEEISAEVGEWQGKLSKVRQEIALAQAAIPAAGSAKRRAEQAKQQLAEVEEREENLQAILSDLNEELERRGEDRRHLEFWAKGFGNSGLPSYLMDAVVPELTERANHYLKTLSDGDIRVAFDTQSKLKSGEAREKLAINWEIEGVPEATPSGGQRKKISIAVDLALMDLVAARERASIDLLMMDEVLDGLDATGKSRIMDLLAELRQKRSTILVVSHDSGISELFENTLTVRKQGRIAVLEEAS